MRGRRGQLLERLRGGDSSHLLWVSWGSVGIKCPTTSVLRTQLGGPCLEAEECGFRECGLDVARNREQRSAQPTMIRLGRGLAGCAWPQNLVMSGVVWDGRAFRGSTVAPERHCPGPLLSPQSWLGVRLL